MNKAISSLIAAAALVLSGGAFAQANNTLATPSTKSPVAVAPANATSGYGTPGATSSDSGMAAPAAGMQNGTSMSPAPANPAYGVNNTLARPSTTSPAAGQ